LLDLHTGLVRKISDQPVDCCTAWSPDGTRIAFTSNNQQAFVWDMRDNTTRSLAPSEFWINIVSWSPDGDGIIARGYGTERGGSDLYLLSPAGDEQTRLTFFTGKNVHNPIWSPDGGHILFTVTSANANELYQIKADGKHLEQLSNHIIGPNLSPNGKRIAYLSVINDNAELYVMNADGSARRRLTWTAEFEGQPVWSPDSAQLLFLTYAGNGDSSHPLHVISPDSREERRLVNEVTFIDSPSWLPDGTQIAYEAQGSGSGVALYIMNADGSNLRLLIEDDLSMALNSAWQPPP
jgi:TolB protein